MRCLISGHTIGHAVEKPDFGLSHGFWIVHGVCVGGSLLSFNVEDEKQLSFGLFI